MTSSGIPSPRCASAGSAHLLHDTAGPNTTSRPRSCARWRRSRSRLELRDICSTLSAPLPAAPTWRKRVYVRERSTTRTACSPRPGPARLRSCQSTRDKLPQDVHDDGRNGPHPISSGGRCSRVKKVVLFAVPVASLRTCSKKNCPAISRSTTISAEGRGTTLSSVHYGLVRLLPRTSSRGQGADAGGRQRRFRISWARD